MTIIIELNPLLQGQQATFSPHLEINPSVRTTHMRTPRNRREGSQFPYNLVCGWPAAACLQLHACTHTCMLPSMPACMVAGGQARRPARGLAHALAPHTQTEHAREARAKIRGVCTPAARRGRGAPPPRRGTC
jgi:hypothetical protein